MDQIKLIALDLDGTTLQNDNTLSQADKAAIEKAIAAGIHVVISTGRVLCEVPPCVTDIAGMDFVISANGAAVTDLSTNRRIYSDCLFCETALEILDAITGQDIFFEMYCAGQSFALDRYTNSLLSFGFDSDAIAFFQNAIQFRPELGSVIFKYPREIEKFYLIFQTLSQKSQMYRQFHGNQNIFITSSGQYNLEMNSATATKGNGLKALCRYLNLSVQQTMAVGDSGNDESILKCAGYSVAMGNASNAIKEIAGAAVAANSENGVSQAIEMAFVHNAKCVIC